MSDKTELTREEVEALLARLPDPQECWYVATGCSWRRILARWSDDGRVVPTNHHRDHHPDLMASQQVSASDTLPLAAAAPTLARQLLATMDKLAEARATLAEVLAGFTEQGHPGRPCVRHGWVSVEQVEKWRAALATTEPPDAD